MQWFVQGHTTSLQVNKQANCISGSFLCHSVLRGLRLSLSNTWVFIRRGAGLLLSLGIFIYIHPSLICVFRRFVLPVHFQFPWTRIPPALNKDQHLIRQCSLTSAAPDNRSFLPTWRILAEHILPSRPVRWAWALEGVPSCTGRADLLLWVKPFTYRALLKTSWPFPSSSFYFLGLLVWNIFELD